MAKKNRTPAIAYLRTSSAANVGPDKDSDTRQREAIQAFAKAAGYEIVAEYYDAAVKGADPVQTRPGFAALLERIKGNGVRTIVVETANRFARDLIVQETGHRMLKAQGIEIIAADKPDAFVEDTPTATLVRQVLGAVAEFDKAMTVAKLRGARERKRRQNGWCEGGAPLHERYPEAVRLAKRLHRANPVTGKRRSLRQIAEELAAAGHLNTAQCRGSRKPGRSIILPSRPWSRGRPRNLAEVTEANRGRVNGQRERLHSSPSRMLQPPACGP